MSCFANQNEFQERLLAAAATFPENLCLISFNATMNSWATIVAFDICGVVIVKPFYGGHWPHSQVLPIHFTKSLYLTEIVSLAVALIKKTWTK